MEKIYRVQMNSKGMPNFSTAVEIADRPQGEWITEYNGTGWNDYWDYTCTNCKMKFPRADDVLHNAHYCPSCGARMKGADDETD